MTYSWPADTTRLNPIPRWLRSSAENAEPEWLRNVTGPRGGTSFSWYPSARTPASRFQNPMQLPPHTAMPASRAIAASRSTSGARSADGGS